MANDKPDTPKLLMVAPSVLLPFDMAWKVRILNILKAAVEKFDVTFLTTCDRNDISNNDAFLKSIGVNSAIFLPSRNRENLATRYLYGGLSLLAKYLFGIPSSLFYYGVINLSSKRIKDSLKGKQFDIVLFEYWFSSTSITFFKKSGIPCVLDMHDILWRKSVSSDRFYSDDVSKKKHVKFLDRRYRKYEETSWQRFDNLIAINHEEALYVRGKINPSISIITAGTGVDLKKWPYCWKPANPHRIVFYGSLSGKENKVAALRCANKIMPLIWSKVPEAELWLVGAKPASSLLSLQANPRVKVTGFVKQVQDVLSTAAVMLCPLKGKYGFRSRLIEAMALGVPLVVTSDAIYGMGLEDGKGIFVYDSDEKIARSTVNLLLSPDFAKEQSILARKQVEEKFSFEATYGRIVLFLLDCVKVGL
jgi:glycosyltransferase involved in cell wall biosynthesis